MDPMAVGRHAFSNFVDSGYRGNAPLHRLPDVLQHTNNVVIEIRGAHDGRDST